MKTITKKLQLDGLLKDEQIKFADPGVACSWTQSGGPRVSIGFGIETLYARRKDRGDAGEGRAYAYFTPTTAIQFGAAVIRNAAYSYEMDAGNRGRKTGRSSREPIDLAKIIEAGIGLVERNLTTIDGEIVLASRNFIEGLAGMVDAHLKTRHIAGRVDPGQVAALVLLILSGSSDRVFGYPIFDGVAHSWTIRKDGEG